MYISNDLNQSIPFSYGYSVWNGPEPILPAATKDRKDGVFSSKRSCLTKKCFKWIACGEHAEVFAAQGASRVAVTCFQDKTSALESVKDEPAPLGLGLVADFAVEILAKVLLGSRKQATNNVPFLYKQATARDVFSVLCELRQAKRLSRSTPRSYIFISFPIHHFSSYLELVYINSDTKK